MDFRKIHEAIIKADAKKVMEETKKAVDENVDPEETLNQGLIVAMHIVGEKFSTGEFFLPEMLHSALAMKEGVKLLKPLLIASGAKAKGRIVIGTVKGDLHDIGKNLVAMMLEGAGFEVIDLGVDVSPEDFLNSLRENQAQVCAMSALLTTTMPNMKETIDLVKRELTDQQIRTIIGGAVVSQKYADDIGADAFAHDASAAVKRVKDLIRTLAAYNTY